MHYAANVMKKLQVTYINSTIKQTFTIIFKTPAPVPVPCSRSRPRSRSWSSYLLYEINRETLIDIDIHYLAYLIESTPDAALIFAKEILQIRLIDIQKQ